MRGAITPLALFGELSSAGKRAGAHPIKLGKTVHDRADVRIGAFDRRDSAMLGNEVKKGPSDLEQPPNKLVQQRGM
jgi:hypothetical protein